MTIPEHRCENCYWWASIDERKFVGLCGHPEHHKTTDRLESCADHETDRGENAS